MKRQETVWVRNNGTKKEDVFRDRYDGEDFEIAPGAVCEMLIETAQLCLGFGEDDKSRCVRRLGWAFTSDRMVDALARLGKFSFHMTEKEALDHDPAKVSKSSAPFGDETPVAAKAAAGGVASSAGKPNLLDKLARANAATAG